ncbi:hypothetical protein PGB28_12915 [Primorskyibacter aestuariivivens]|uniref:hypothetical protein n=1 Tax=Primorskyibacter aestuariivivens TaxID=1888912 RepID=UPI0023007760|nr:hypothetical protein [Primorskyibacter aestuariivivens]MDA7429366.1 hypothetical protein [Primorskyibacter aestuariivivens]
MKTLILSAVTFAAVWSTEAQADTWSWAPIRDGNTLNAHLARCDFARPAPLRVFAMIEALQEGGAEPNGS